MTNDCKITKTKCKLCCNGIYDLCDRFKFNFKESPCMKAKKFNKILVSTGVWMKKLDISCGIVYFNGSVYLQFLNDTKDKTSTVYSSFVEFNCPISNYNDMISHGIRERILYWDGSIYLETTENDSYNCRKLEEMKSEEK